MIARNRVMEITSEDDDFLPLLGTVHGKGLARKLAAYPRFFGGKMMKRVRMYPHENPHVCWVLETGAIAARATTELIPHKKKKSRSSQSSLAYVLRQLRNISKVCKGHENNTLPPIHIIRSYLDPGIETRVRLLCTAWFPRSRLYDKPLISTLKAI